jgi:hypothetical protein
MTKALLAIGDTTRLVENLFTSNGPRELFFSYGDIIPDLSTYEASYWMGGLYAAKLRQIGLAANLCSPGPKWLPSLDRAITGREVTEGKLINLSDTVGEFWVKPSEAKISTIPAGLYSYDKLKGLFEEGSFSSEISLQWTHEVLNINYEHRFFVAEGEILTGSPYLVDGKGYRTDIDTSHMPEAQAFAEYVLASDPMNMPPAFTLDVGLNAITDKWFVIEANRAWSSGLYGCDPTAASDVIEYACSSPAIESKWQWKPDTHLTKLVQGLQALEVVNANEESSGFLKYVP